MSGRGHSILAAALALGACVAGPQDASDPAAANGPAARLQRLIDADKRVLEVAWRLQTANVERCTVRGGDAGWALHGAVQYAPALRTLTETSYDLDRALPGVIAVVVDGPADRAGIKAGDVIVAVGDHHLSSDDTVEAFERNQADITAALTPARPVQVTVRREGDEQTLTVAPVMACGYRAEAEPGEVLNAWADGRGIFASVGMVYFTDNDDELALVLGHELSHNILGHRDREGRLTVPAFGGRQAELDADRHGLLLMEVAGYDPAVGPSFFRRLGAAGPIGGLLTGHPTAEERARRLDQALAQRVPGGSRPPRNGGAQK